MSEIKNISTATIKKLGRDYHVGDNINTYVNNYTSQRRKLHFETVTKGTEEFKDYPKPYFIEEIFTRAKSEHMVLVGGISGFNKGLFLQYVAITLKAEGLEVKECADFDDFSGLSTAIQEESKQCVFILYNLTAKVISYRFKDLKALGQQKDHIILGSTDEPYQSWMFSEEDTNPSWFQIPEKGLYPKETLAAYLNGALQRKNLKLPVPTNKIIATLPRLEQLDIFIDTLVKFGSNVDIQTVEKALEISAKDDYSDIGPWFYSLNGFDKLIVIGLTFFYGAYEEQVFAGFERILRLAWQERNKDLRPIDYEDIIPLMSYLKFEGKLITGITEDQRRKVIQLAWRTHKRYILSAIPILEQIIYDSVDTEKVDLELFGTYNHRKRILAVLSDTFSDIALQSFEDVDLSLMVIASKANLNIQMVAANAISRWKEFNEEKIYDILEMWQQRTAFEVINKDANEFIANVRSVIPLVLFRTSRDDKANNLSSRITDLLLKFLDNTEQIIVERMLVAIENLTAYHPIAMNSLLKDTFLKYDYYIGPIRSGFVSAYNNGFDHDVKNILNEWLKYCRELKEKPEERDGFSHRERILSVVILTLKYIDYNNGPKSISIAEAYEILEDLRKN